MAKPAPRRPNVVAFVMLGVIALALVAVVVGLVAGGGDDDDDGGTTASTEVEAGEVERTGDVLPRLDDPASDPAIGLPAPILDGETFAGDAVRIPADGPAVVVFLAHWCPHCQREVQFLVPYFDAQGMPEGVDVFGVATSIDPAAPNYPPSRWLADERWTVPTLVDDADDSAATAYGLSSYPYFVAIDADGNVAARISGELEAPQLEALFDAARRG